jgi:cyclophilin family peptidyl-prolyl cis-trans isomerase
MSHFIIETELGSIRLKFNTKTPITCDHVKRISALDTFSTGAAHFYRSDFVIQFGVHGSKIAREKLVANESKSSGMSNTRGTAAFAHWDVPDCGDTEIFINLKENSHLDTAYGGFCVFAYVEETDLESFKTIDTIAAAIPKSKKVSIRGVRVE